MAGQGGKRGPGTDGAEPRRGEASDGPGAGPAARRAKGRLTKELLHRLSRRAGIHPARDFFPGLAGPRGPRLQQGRRPALRAVRRVGFERGRLSLRQDPAPRYRLDGLGHPDVAHHCRLHHMRARIRIPAAGREAACRGSPRRGRATRRAPSIVAPAWRPRSAGIPPRFCAATSRVCQEDPCCRYPWPIPP